MIDSGLSGITGLRPGRGRCIAPTAKPFAVPGMIIAHVAGGRIQTIPGAFDGLGLLQRLGVMPTPTHDTLAPEAERPRPA